MIERIGEAFEGDIRLTVVGAKLKTGERAPDFNLEYIDPKNPAVVRNLRLADLKGQAALLNVINSIDTPVCHVETCKWEKHRLEAPAGVKLLTISMDLPFALLRWQTAERVDHLFLSAHQGKEFGQDYGVLLKEWRLLQRAVFALDKQGIVAYAQYVNDQMLEPDYVSALQVVRELAK